MNIFRELNMLQNAALTLQREMVSLYGPYYRILQRRFRKHDSLCRRMVRRQCTERLELSSNPQFSKAYNRCYVLNTGSAEDYEVVKKYDEIVWRISQRLQRVIDTDKKKLSKIEKKAAKYYARNKDQRWMTLTSK